MTEDKNNKSLENKPQENKAEENKSLQQKPEKKPVPGDKTKATNKFVYVLLVLFFIIVCIALLFINNRVDEINKNINQAEIEDSNLFKNTDDRINDVLSRFSTIQSRLKELESKQDVLSHSLSQSVEQEIHINEDYALAEVEHLLIIASYNLQLDHDVATALSAMESADARLNGLRDPAVLSVREQLIEDMNTLRSLNQADLSGLALFLSDLINRVDQLPLKENIVLEQTAQKSLSNEEQVNGIKQFFLLVWNELKSLVVITRDNNVSKARLLPDEIYYLRANLKLELANARFAVFTRDTENLNASINHIQAWLNEYFDLSDAAVKNIYDSFSRMKKLELAFPELDISSSLESVRALIRYQDETNSADNDKGTVDIQ